MTLLAPLPGLSTRPLTWLRARFRESEAWFIALAIGVGAAAGLMAVVQGRLSHLLQMRLFGGAPDSTLSATRRPSSARSDDRASGSSASTRLSAASNARPAGSFQLNGVELMRAL